ncbi:hypothetical protein B0J11DRAFT_565764 [Dendryphion nanum]|uniref:BRCT domain-containing protein n=1 Tax=Dendryphion nanum TaxID=256645 RepID=A0A9P9E7J4_9PLEO|nr:hypothetical protein B0J11DRAFT_565764 [Dendryphion nanum]
MAILKNLVITVSGDVGPRPEQLRKWVEVNGGQWVPRIVKGATHLICSKEHWKSGNEAVTMAMRFGTHIVNYDWLEDSLQRGRKLSERTYLWSKVQKKMKKMKRVKKMGKKFDAQTFKKGSDKALAETGSGTSLISTPPAPSTFQSALQELAERRARRAALETMSNQDAPNGLTEGGTLHIDNDEDITKAARSTKGHEAFGVERNISKTYVTPLSQKPSALPSTVNLASVSTATTTPSDTLVKASATTAPDSTLAPSSNYSGPKAHKLKDNFHTYVDSTDFPYDVILVRPNKARATQANYTIRLFESNTKPATYCTVVRYTPAPGTSWPPENDLIHTPGIPGVRYPPPPLDNNQSLPNFPIQPSHPPDLHLLAAHATLQLTKPSSALPYRTILCSITSSFPTAFTLFRLTFRTLTLLHWHERLHPSPRTLQTPRAISLNLEPYFYHPPQPGLPNGLLPDSALPSEEQEPYPRTFTQHGLALPGMDVPLNREGPVGGQMARDAEMERRRRAEEEEIRDREEREKKRKARAARNGGAGRNNVPLFNGVRGRPVGVSTQDGLLGQQSVARNRFPGFRGQ